MRPSWLVLPLVVALGCTPKASPGPAGIELAESTVAEVAAPLKAYPGHVVAYSAARGLVVDDVVVAAPGGYSGLPAAVKRDGAHGFLVNPLYDVLKDRRGALLALEAATPYRVVVELGYTVGQSEADTIDFLVRHGAEPRKLSIAMPRSGELVCLMGVPRAAASAEIERRGLDLLAALGGDGGRDAAADRAGPPAPLPPSAPTPLGSREALCLSVLVSTDGVHVRAGANVLDRTCGAFLAEGDVRPTFPRVGGRLDLGGLGACARTLAALPGAGAGRVLVSAPASVPFGEFVEALDALRVDGLAPPALGTAR